MLTVSERDLSVLLAENGGRRSWRLPSANWDGGASPVAVAQRLYRAVIHARPAWCEHVRACSDGAHRDAADVSLVFAATVIERSAAPEGTEWYSVARLPSALASRDRKAIMLAAGALRELVDRAPVAFRLLPASFTLSDVQRVYETLLEHALHKASFRRSLLAAQIVEGTGGWRREGRGRPAQLYRFAPRSPRSALPLRFNMRAD